MNRRATKKKHKWKPLPPPPPAQALFLTILEAAGLLRWQRGTVEEIRRVDPTFPKPRLITGGAPRFVRSELEAWVLSRPAGWSTKGGARRSAAA